MPTGYTAAVANGEVTDFRTFALRCARAMGACVTLRDERLDAQLPERFEPSPYHHDALVAAQAALNEVLGLSDVECEEGAAAEHRDALRREDEHRANRERTRARYQAMLEKVRAWTPPTPEHAGLREFMERQLRESIAFDTGHTGMPEPQRRTGRVWRERTLAKARDDIRYHEREHAEEVARAADRTAWLKALRASL